MSDAARVAIPGGGDGGKTITYDSGNDEWDLTAFRYEHTEVSPAIVWTINHNLGYRPTIQVFTAGGVEIWAAVQHVSVNQATVNFNIAQAGFARAV